ncbi:hypothetical protein [Endozoicomonas sp. GU-1]|uniref:hypothetical protein n=1 Tax=Endozoicomonas sp. GU-1 TaxID=3009078 RepID=UPI0022B3E10E|nr:hypothetical protein [Endozoicomonas sp. GU-1]WBA83745.1 hypothetical protein O2T12_11815 [Endozoicomonas sp. GU-1]WBA86725.1 hypothetical protein O3276_01380 [Endozoicomonas sp. GU-1]
MPVTFYSSDDPGAPKFVYSGSSGSYKIGIIDVLDAILVNGYSGKTGLGWTKLMTSAVAGSDRTVYRNQSAYESNCHLLAESSPTNSGCFKMQIADVVTSPEDYSGYSQVINTYVSGYKWMAVGDERSFIFFAYPSSMYTAFSSIFNSVMPLCIYIGDVDRLNNTTHIGHVLITNSMYSGTMGTVTSYSSRPSFFESFSERILTNKTIRPVTQVPGEEWSENDCYHFLTSILPDNAANAAGAGKNIASFEQAAQLRVPWFLVINQVYVYRLRGLYNIFPMLQHNDVSSRAQMLKPLNIDGIEYRGTKQNADRYNGVPMSYYIQTSGDW